MPIDLKHINIKNTINFDVDEENGCMSNRVDGPNMSKIIVGIDRGV